MIVLRGKNIIPRDRKIAEWSYIDFFILSFFNIMWSRRDALGQKIFKMIKKTSGSDVIDSLNFLIQKSNLRQVLILDEFQFKYLMKNIVR